MASTVDVAEIKRKIEQDLYELERCCKQYEDEEFCNKLRNKYVAAYNKLATAILETPMLPKKPMDPFVAVVVGNSIGGLAVGITAGMSAVEKNKIYDRVLAEFKSSQTGVNGALEELGHWHTLVCEYINDHPYTPDLDNETQKRLAERAKNNNIVVRADIGRLEKERVQQESVIQQNANKLLGKGAKAKRDAKKRLIEIEIEIEKLQTKIMPEE